MRSMHNAYLWYNPRYLCTHARIAELDTKDRIQGVHILRHQSMEHTTTPEVYESGDDQCTILSVGVSVYMYNIIHNA